MKEHKMHIQYLKEEVKQQNGFQEALKSLLEADIKLRNPNLKNQVINIYNITFGPSNSGIMFDTIFCTWTVIEDKKQISFLCDSCYGSGQIFYDGYSKRCSRCNGTGKEKNNEGNRNLETPTQES